MSTDRLLSWLLTYSVHSTLFLGLAWLVAGRLSRRAPAAAEIVWRFALVAGLATATLSSLSNWQPVGGAWTLATRSALPATAPAEILPISSLAERALPAPPFEAAGLRPAQWAAAPAPMELPAAAPRAAAVRPSWTNVALAIWACGALLLTLGAARAYFRLRLRLRDRPRVVGGDLYAQLRQLAGSAEVGGVRLTCSSRVPVPLALGWNRREICVPPRALAALTAEQQEGMLAHELAHLVRRDPVWLIATHLVTCVAFFQPLNWLARRRLRELSELLADEWAVGRTGRPLSLAGCLAEVAGWAFGHHRLPVAAMADRPSNLARRITRLLDGDKGPGRVRRLVLGTGLGLSLVAVLGAAPVVRSAETDAAADAKAKARAAAHQDSLAGSEKATAEHRARHEAGEEKADCDHDHHEGVHAAMMADSIQASIQASIHEAVRAAVHDGRAGGPPDDEDDVDVDDEVEDAVDDAVEAAVEGAVEGAMAGVDASLESLDSLNGLSEALDGLDDELEVDIDQDLEREIERSAADLDRLRAEGKLSREQQRELAHKMSRMAQDLQHRLQPQLQQMSREVARQVQQSLANSDEMRKLAADLAKRSAELRPDPEAVHRLQEMAKSLAADGKVSAEEAERLGQEAKRMAESIKMSEPQLKEMAELARKHGEMARKAVEEHRDEIEAAQRDMKQAIEIEMQGVRKELERQKIELRQRQKEERRQHHEEKEEPAPPPPTR